MSTTITSWRCTDGTENDGQATFCSVCGKQRVECEAKPLGPKPQVGKEYDVTISDLSKRKDGIAKIEGFVVFVRGAEKGSTVKIVVTKVLDKFGFGNVVRSPPVEAGKEYDLLITEQKGRDGIAKLDGYVIFVRNASPSPDPQKARIVRNMAHSSEAELVNPQKFEPPVKVGEEYKVAIKPNSKGGDPVAWINGVVTFVKRAIPSDAPVDIRIVYVGERSATAELVNQPEPPVKKGEAYDVTIVGVGKYGDGIGVIEGSNFQIFVPGAKEGTKLNVTVVSVGPDRAKAVPTELYNQAKNAQEEFRPVNRGEGRKPRTQRNRRRDEEERPREIPVEIDGEYEVVIESTSRNGDGLARIKGMVVFVSGAKPSAEPVKIKIDRVMLKASIAHLMSPQEEQKGTTYGYVGLYACETCTGAPTIPFHLEANFSDPKEVEEAIKNLPEPHCPKDTTHKLKLVFSQIVPTLSYPRRVGHRREPYHRDSSSGKVKNRRQKLSFDANAIPTARPAEPERPLQGVPAWFSAPMTVELKGVESVIGTEKGDNYFIRVSADGTAANMSKVLAKLSLNKPIQELVQALDREYAREPPKETKGLACRSGCGSKFPTEERRKMHEEESHAARQVPSSLSARLAGKLASGLPVLQNQEALLVPKASDSLKAILDKRVFSYTINGDDLLTAAEQRDLDSFDRASERGSEEALRELKEGLLSEAWTITEESEYTKVAGVCSMIQRTVLENGVPVLRSTPVYRSLKPMPIGSIPSDYAEFRKRGNSRQMWRVVEGVVTEVSFPRAIPIVDRSGKPLKTIIAAKCTVKDRSGEAPVELQGARCNLNPGDRVRIDGVVMEKKNGLVFRSREITKFVFRKS